MFDKLQAQNVYKNNPCSYSLCHSLKHIEVHVFFCYLPLSLFLTHNICKLASLYSLRTFFSFSLNPPFFFLSLYLSLPLSFYTICSHFVNPIFYAATSFWVFLCHFLSHFCFSFYPPLTLHLSAPLSPFLSFPLLFSLSAWFCYEKRDTGVCTNSFLLCLVEALLITLLPCSFINFFFFVLHTVSVFLPVSLWIRQVSLLSMSLCNFGVCFVSQSLCVCVFLFLFISLYLCFSVCRYIWMPVYLYILLSVP